MNQKKIDNTPTTIRQTNPTTNCSRKLQGLRLFPGTMGVETRNSYILRAKTLQIHSSSIDFVVGGPLLNPDVSRQYTETDTEPLTQLSVTTV